MNGRCPTVSISLIFSSLVDISFRGEHIDPELREVLELKPPPNNPSAASCGTPVLMDIFDWLRPRRYCMAPSNGVRMRVIENLKLGSGHRITLVEVDNRTILLSASTKGVTYLTEIGVSSATVN